MSAIHKLLRIGLPVLLAMGTMGCANVDAAPVSTDFVGSDIPQKNPPPIAQTLYEPNGQIFAVEMNAAPSASDDETVRSILPSYGDLIRENQQDNRDVIGWLHVPDTTIDHPILQNPSENNTYEKKNNYYLNQNFDGNPDKNGVFCADYRANFGAGGQNTLSRISALYGHSWDDNPDGTLFSQLKKYRDPDFARAHPYVFFSTESQDMVWEVVAVFDTTIYLPYVRPNLPSDKFQQTLDMIRKLSYYSYEESVGEDDKLLVLSTCTFSVAGRPSLPELNDYRFVVMARLVDPAEPLKQEAAFAVNDSPLLPDETRALRHL